MKIATRTLVRLRLGDIQAAYSSSGGSLHAGPKKKLSIAWSEDKAAHLRISSKERLAYMGYDILTVT